jgi:hypothetical protein
VLVHASDCGRRVPHHRLLSLCEWDVASYGLAFGDHDTAAAEVVAADDVAAGAAVGGYLTTEDTASQILADGFRNSLGDSFFPAGVWLSDSSDLRHRAMYHVGGAMLVVDVPDDVAERFLSAEFPDAGVNTAFRPPSSTAYP